MPSRAVARGEGGRDYGGPLWAEAHLLQPAAGLPKLRELPCEARCWGFCPETLPQITRL